MNKNKIKGLYKHKKNNLISLAQVIAMCRGWIFCPRWTGEYLTLSVHHTSHPELTIFFPSSTSIRIPDQNKHQWLEDSIDNYNWLEDDGRRGLTVVGTVGQVGATGYLQTSFWWLLGDVQVVRWLCHIPQFSLERKPGTCAGREQVKFSCCNWKTKTSARNGGYLLQRQNLTRVWTGGPKLWHTLQSTSSRCLLTSLLTAWVQLGAFELHLQEPPGSPRLHNTIWASGWWFRLREWNTWKSSLEV